MLYQIDRLNNRRKENKCKFLIEDALLESSTISKIMNYHLKKEEQSMIKVENKTLYLEILFREI